MKSFGEARGGRRGALKLVSFFSPRTDSVFFQCHIFTRIVIIAVAAFVVDFRKIMTMMVSIIVIITVIVYY